ncbi:M20 family metallopeptidase [Prosthecodimorpha staleyi]|uniref:M20 family metallopeptidase n=1 Tax=Prosthecodimorpha staleyi TaxID=2840188 RepID=A0A947GDK2_9HYPH|nr:M20 family metallopeptidase [Prosthecodimorpha staleyi]MBT9290927.1 M20 family metallopeptidase [Prosthecodimorpha staleyi]
MPTVSADPAPNLLDNEVLLAGLRRWVEIETPTGAVVEIGRLLDRITDDLRPLGAALERIPGRDGMGDHLIARFAGGAGAGRGVLITCHLDTVCPPGSLPMRRDGDRFYGPGIADMKGGAFLAFAALREILGSAEGLRGPVTLIYNTDEEIGSPTSHALIEREARGAACVLVPEPARGDEVLTFRKGRAQYGIDIFGRESHAGSAHADGRSAISELARTIVALDALTDPATETTLNVGRIAGGTEPNVVAGHARCDIDVRFVDDGIGRAIDRRIRGLVPQDPDIRIEVGGGIEKPCLARTPGTLDLFAVARRINQGLGVPLVETRSGGGSDGNFAAAVGTPTLDGLGAIGNAWHSPAEHIAVSALARREFLLRSLIQELAAR